MSRVEPQAWFAEIERRLSKDGDQPHRRKCVTHKERDDAPPCRAPPGWKKENPIQPAWRAGSCVDTAS